MRPAPCSSADVRRLTRGGPNWASFEPPGTPEGTSDAALELLQASHEIGLSKRQAFATIDGGARASVRIGRMVGWPLLDDVIFGPRDVLKPWTPLSLNGSRGLIRSPPRSGQRWRRRTYRAARWPVISTSRQTTSPSSARSSR